MRRAVPEIEASLEENIRFDTQQLGNDLYDDGPESLDCSHELRGFGAGHGNPHQLCCTSLSWNSTGRL